MINKKGSNFVIWIEIMALVILFFVIIVYINNGMNSTYNQNQDLSLGMNMSSQLDSLSSFKSNAINSTNGQTSLTDYGILKILAVPSMLVQLGSILWNFVDGSIIYNLVIGMNLGGSYSQTVALILQIIFVSSIVFIFIRMVLRVT